MDNTFFIMPLDELAAEVAEEIRAIATAEGVEVSPRGEASYDDEGKPHDFRVNTVSVRDAGTPDNGMWGYVSAANWIALYDAHQADA